MAPDTVPVAYPPRPLVTSHSFQTSDCRPSSVGSHRTVLTSSGMVRSITLMGLSEIALTSGDGFQHRRRMPGNPPAVRGAHLRCAEASVSRVFARPVQVPFVSIGRRDKRLGDRAGDE